MANNAGQHNAIRMYQMFTKDKYSRVRLIMDENETTLTIYPFNGIYTERQITKYRFNEDGYYEKQSNT